MTASGLDASVSVVIPTYNSGCLLVEAIKSVLGQTVTAAEIVVVDDGSVDGTPEHIVPYGDRVRYLRQSNEGVAAARNRGISEARSPFVAFLDADDVWHPRKLEYQLPWFVKFPNLGLLGTATYDWPAQVYPDLTGAHTEEPCFIPWTQLVVKNYFTTSSVIVRREVLDRTGPFDIRLRGPEDYDLWVRLAESAAVANLALPLTGYRMVQGSLSQQATSMENGLRTILEKLDQREVWRGRRLLRRKAYSFFNYSTAYIHKAAGSPGRAMRNLLRSFVWYPFPYGRSEVRLSMARPRMLARLLVSSIDGTPREADDARS